MTKTNTTFTVAMNDKISRRFSVESRDDGFIVKVEDSWKGEWERVSIAGAKVRSSQNAAEMDMVSMVEEFESMTGNQAVEN